MLQIPQTTKGERVPLVVLFHGAGGAGAGILQVLESVAESSRIAILAPDSIDRTWDAIMVAPRDIFDIAGGTRRFRGFGPDVAALDRALEQVLKTIAVDADRVIAAGFSDGATYALSLAVANGTLFRRVVAFSPGFIVESQRDGRPEIYISHGRHDRVLPIDRCSRRIVPHLKTMGYAVTYREFEGEHEMPDEIVREAITWAVR